MRRTISFVALVIVLFGGIFGCTGKQGDWKIVNLGTCGEMKIPAQWQCCTENDILYILDENNKPVMIECELYGFYELGTSNKYFCEFRFERLVSNAGLSNCAMYGKEVILHDGVEKEVLFLDVGYGNEEKHFVVWDTTRSLKEVREIAETFKLPA